MHTDNQLPLVSIVITSYNREQTIGEAIRSATEQTYPNIEIIISDNCSTDNSMQVINQYAGNPLVRIFRNDTNIGMVPNFKRATEELASGDFITYVSSDDCLIDPHFIEDAMKLVAKHPDVFLVFGKLRQVTPDGGVVGETNEYPFWLNEFAQGRDVFLRYVENSWLSWGGCVLKRTELNAFRPFDFYHSAKDIEINLRLMLKGNAAFINRFCYEQGIHFQNASLSGNIDSKMDIARYCYVETSKAAIDEYPEDRQRFESWRDTALHIYFKQLLIFLQLDNPSEYKMALGRVKAEYPEVYRLINRDLRFRLMNTLYHPVLFPLLRILSPKRYAYFRKKNNS